MHFCLAHRQDSSQAAPWQLRCGAVNRAAATWHLETTHSATGFARGEFDLSTQANIQSSSPQLHPIAQVCTLAHSASPRHFCTSASQCSLVHSQASLQVDELQSTCELVALKKEAPEHLPLMHSATGRANGELVFPAQAKRQSSSPQPHVMAQSCTLAHSASPRHFSTSASQCSLLHSQAALQVDALQSTCELVALKKETLEHLPLMHSATGRANGELVFPAQ